MELEDMIKVGTELVVQCTKFEKCFAECNNGFNGEVAVIVEKRDGDLINLSHLSGDKIPLDFCLEGNEKGTFLNSAEYSLKVFTITNK